MPGLVAFLTELAGPAGAGLIEVRTRVERDVMRPAFFAAAAAEAAAAAIRRDGVGSDVFVGVVPRTRRSGGRAAVGPVWSLWADADDEPAAAALEGFDPRPSIVVRSGSRHGLHTYWLLDRPLDPVHAERANRRLATALGADPQSTDAARILRPPETKNHKYAPPAAVTLERFEPVRLRPSAIVGELADGPFPARVRPPRVLPAQDALHAIPPHVYVERLTGVTVPRSRKIRCPFHDDGSPSLHVYRDAHRGWYCFGCGRGGSIYDFAAALWKLGTRGDGFKELRRRLARAVGAGPELRI